jgi:hypothetical protein
MNFANSPNLTGKDGYSYPALYGWQFDSARKTAAEGAPPASAPPALGSIVLNLSDSIVQLDLAGMDFENAKYQQLSADPRTLVTNESSLKSQQGVASAAVALPPHSVTQLVAQ